MVLSDHSLRQIDYAYLSSLSEPQLLSLSDKLLSDLKEAREQLNQNPSNSSRPPSSQAPWVVRDDEQLEADEDADELRPDEGSGGLGEDDDEAEEHLASSEGDSAPLEVSPKPQGKAGKPKDAPGYGRTQELPVTDTVHHTADCCEGCGREAPGEMDGQVAWTGYYTIDIEIGEESAPGIAVTNTKHLFYDLVCQCGHITREAPYRAPKNGLWEEVALTQWRLVGPMLCALVLALTYRSRMSRARVREFLWEWLGLSLSVGTLQRCIEETARAARPVEDQLVDEVVASDLLHADETSHPQRKSKLWLWVVVCSTTVLYYVGSRSSEIVVRLLGEKFLGWLMTDGYGSYRRFLRRLRCWAHLLRKARGLKDSLNTEAQEFGRCVSELLHALMKAVYLAREGLGEDLEPAWRDALATFRSECERMKLSTHEKTRQLAVELLNDWDAIFAVLHHPASALNQQRGRTDAVSLGYLASHYLWNPLQSREQSVRPAGERHRYLPQARGLALAVSGRGDRCSTPRTTSTLASSRLNPEAFGLDSEPSESSGYSSPAPGQQQGRVTNAQFGYIARSLLWNMNGSSQQGLVLLPKVIDFRK